MTFCPNCGFKLLEPLNFCPKCGHSLKEPEKPNLRESVEAQETAFYKGQGNMIVKTIRKQGVATKVGVYLFTGPVGFLLWGRDKKKKVKGVGSLIVTNKTIYFAGRDYPFERIGSIIKKGNSILVDVDVSKASTFGSGWVDVVRTGITGESCTVELEIQTEEVDKVFTALEQAKLSHIKF